MNPRIKKLKDEIEKTKDRVNKGQVRLRELEKQLTDLENADIVAAVRGVDIAPDELDAFVKMFKAKQHGGTVPSLEKSSTSHTDTATSPTTGISTTNHKNDKEDLANEN